jgi:CheY-like chemotaxis protein
VKLYLPRAATPDAVQTEEQKDQPQPTEARSEAILVVEDNDLLAASVSNMLHDQEYFVLTAPNAAAALRLLDTNPDVRLLFTDVELLGGMDGRQLADKARQRASWPFGALYDRLHPKCHHSSGQTRPGCRVDRQTIHLR